jgi:uncharacterized protein (DUF934 family)
MRVADRNGLVAGDPWTGVTDDDAIPVGASVIVSFDRLRNDHNAVFAAANAVGVEVPGNVDFDELNPFLPRLKLIVVRFATMRDGRVFSAGRLLRERYGFTGDLRAAGDFIPDQILFLLRCGFSTFAIPDSFSLDSLKRAVAAYSAWYQRATDGAPTVAELRTKGDGG